MEAAEGEGEDLGQRREAEAGELPVLVHPYLSVII
jgi:hypothetical protein